MRDTASSFSSLLEDNLSLRQRPRRTSADATTIATPVATSVATSSAITSAISSATSVAAHGPSHPTPLPDMPADCLGYLAANETSGLLKQRLVDLGFTIGTPLRLARKGPKGKLIAVRVRNTVIALRSSEARSLLIAPDPAAFPASDG